MKFKGKSFIAIVLSPEPPFTDWLQEIDRIIVRSPGFFIDRPIILDVRGSKIPIDELEQLLEELGSRSIRVMGIDGVAGTRLKPGMPPSFSGGRLASDIDVPTPAAGGAAEDDADEPAAGPTAAKADKSAETPKPAAKSKGKAARATAETVAAPASVVSGSSIVITEPVRSGQSILHPEGDVTVIGSVSSGAEIIAGGSIHVYGALRGRALAGVSGKDCARIFCSKLDAELVSINGLYKVADDFDGALRNAPAQIRFEDETLVFEGLN
ncbi:septum site-determining protein MinC [Roseibium sediminicola]|uniref:Probable septum site-determining protein MinC n=1 Tax=Roseibium sediminicola TaxID=2933272 RepID=A0ABT0H0X7_9HYPH|nr:septum site-determining protein MinC [Roseibium sp. CAU 1639]MCK7615120.1 septum site-determining protein MinC [Roseibium sp. CAU 1639]